MWSSLFGVGALLLLAGPAAACDPAMPRKRLIIDTDLFSDVDDAAALLLAATACAAELLAVHVNVPSSYSARAASALLAHYGGDKDVPISIRRPLSDAAFFDAYYFALGEYASKVAHHFPGGALAGDADKAERPVALYRRVLAAAPDASVTVASIGFLDNLADLLDSPPDATANLTGSELVKTKVAELIVMGGMYPAGREFNFFGGPDPAAAARVVNRWPGPIVFSGGELGGNVTSGGPDVWANASAGDPVARAYAWYTYGVPRFSWDPLTVLYAMGGLGRLFAFGNTGGYNRVSPDGANEWVDDPAVTNQHYLVLRPGVDNVTAGAELDRLYLVGAEMAAKTRGDAGEEAREQAL